MLTKYDMADLQLPPRHALQPRISSLAIRVPGKHEFFRVHPDEDFTACFSLLEDKGYRNNIYVVHPNLVEQVGQDAFEAQLHLAVNRDGEYFILYCKFPSRPDEPYATTRLEVVEESKQSWVRMMSKDDGDGYQALKAGAALSDPIWPDKPFMELLENIGDRVIDDSDHPLLKRLRGDL